MGYGERISVAWSVLWRQYLFGTLSYFAFLVAAGTIINRIFATGTARNEALSLSTALLFLPWMIFAVTPICVVHAMRAHHARLRFAITRQGIETPVTSLIHSEALQASIPFTIANGVVLTLDWALHSVALPLRGATAIGVLEAGEFALALLGLYPLAIAILLKLKFSTFSIQVTAPATLSSLADGEARA